MSSLIHGFGLMLVIGFLCAMQLAKFSPARAGWMGRRSPTLPAGIIYRRGRGGLSHVLENLGDFTRSDRTVGRTSSR